MPRGSKVLVIRPEFGPQPTAQDFFFLSISFASSLTVPVSSVEMGNKVSGWTSPDSIYCVAPATEGSTLIIICATFQAGRTVSPGNTLIAAIFCHQLMTDLMQ